jgi:hypothetical protein
MSGGPIIFLPAEFIQNIFAQSPRVGVTYMIYPALHAGIELGEANSSALPLIKALV